MVSIQTQRLRDAVLILSALIPGTVAQLFTISCAPLAIYRGDPLVFDGQISSHVHAIVGGTAFDLHLPNEKARRGKATTCDKVLDRSSYWQPQLYHERKDGKFEIVELQGMVRSFGSGPSVQNAVITTATGHLLLLQSLN